MHYLLEKCYSWGIESPSGTTSSLAVPMDSLPPSFAKRCSVDFLADEALIANKFMVGTHASNGCSEPAVSEVAEKSHGLRAADAYTLCTLSGMLFRKCNEEQNLTYAKADWSEYIQSIDAELDAELSSCAESSIESSRKHHQREEIVYAYKNSNTKARENVVAEICEGDNFIAYMGIRFPGVFSWVKFIEERSSNSGYLSHSLGSANASSTSATGEDCHAFIQDMHEKNSMVDGMALSVSPKLIDMKMDDHDSFGFHSAAFMDEGQNGNASSGTELLRTLYEGFQPTVEAFNPTSLQAIKFHDIDFTNDSEGSKMSERDFIPDFTLNAGSNDVWEAWPTMGTPGKDSSADL